MIFCDVARDNPTFHHAPRPASSAAPKSLRQMSTERRCVIAATIAAATSSSCVSPDVALAAGSESCRCVSSTVGRARKSRSSTIITTTNRPSAAKVRPRPNRLRLSPCRIGFTIMSLAPDLTGFENLSALIYIGMLPCFFDGSIACLSRSSSNAAISRGRVSAGMRISSM